MAASVVLAMVPALLVDALSVPVCYLLSIGLGLAIGLGLRLAGVPFSHLWPIFGGLLFAVLIPGSGMVPTAGRYMPFLVLACVLALSFVLAYGRRPRAVVRPGRTVTLVVLGYLVWAFLTAATSTQSALSFDYVAGAAGTLALALLVIPTLVRDVGGGRAALVVLASLGPLLAVAAFILVITGPVTWAGHTLGLNLIDQLVVGGHKTGIAFVNATGVFVAPSYPAAALAVSVVAILALRPTLSVTRERWALLALVVCSVALLLGLNRGGWLATGVGAFVVAALALRRRRLDGWSIGTGLFFIGVLAALTLRLFTVDLQPATPVAVPGSQVPTGTISPATGGGGSDEPIEIRGGGSLSGREVLWKASLDAIAQRPLLGYGMGTNPEAIAPYIPGPSARFRGLTSHDTWLRTAVELGVPGLLWLGLFVIAALAGWARRFARGQPDRVEPVMIGLVAAFATLVVGGSFEAYLLGGVSFPSFALALLVGLQVSATREADGLSTPTPAGVVAS